MTYPITAVFNKASSTIEKTVYKVSNEFGIPMNIMPYILDRVRANILSEELNMLSDISIELTNDNEELKTKLPPEPKNTKEGKTEET